MSNNLELLAPAGDMEKLKTAIEYGADAIYFAGKDFGLRTASDNFTIDELKEAVNLAHESNVKCYLTINIYPHNGDIGPLEDYLEDIKDIAIDGFLVSDPGAMTLLKRHVPEAIIHLSTQANMTNYVTANFWYEQGVRRIVVAREMSIEEIRELRDNIPQDMEIEAFVHGAMCISYSGRCLLSNFMVGRDANKGECAHACRWKYSLIEEERPGEYYPIEEDDRGTYIMNSKDLCMIDHIKDLIDAGVTSFKIEGRVKSVFYLATVVSQYKKAIDDAAEGKEWDPDTLSEISKVSNREFTRGFFYNKPDHESQNYETSAYRRDYSFIGVVKEYDETTGIAIVEQRNKMTLGDVIEVFGPDIDFFEQRLEVMKDEDGEDIESAPHPQQTLMIKMDKPVKSGYMIRKERNS